MLVSKSTISVICSSVGGVSACICPITASVTCERSAEATESAFAISRPSHITVLKKRRLDVGRGRRNTESSVGEAVVCGSLIRSTPNSAFAGILSATRISPLLRIIVVLRRRASTVDISPVGELAPSTGAKSGSSPCVRSKRLCANSGFMLNPSEIA